MIPPVKLRQACSRPRREKGITLPSTIWKATRWAPEKRPSIRRKKRVAARSGAPEKNQPAKAMPRICTRINVPMRIEAGSTRLRCSICGAPMIGAEETLVLGFRTDLLGVARGGLRRGEFGGLDLGQDRDLVRGYGFVQRL